MFRLSFYKDFAFDRIRSLSPKHAVAGRKTGGDEVKGVANIGLFQKELQAAA
jgi:hypothetical protein